MIYTPDAWTIIELTPKDKEPIYKVLAGWYGGYLDGDSWRLNSGITEITEHESYYAVEGDSGSTYECYKDSERMSGIMISAYTSIEQRLKETGAAEVSTVDISTILEQFIHP